MTIDTVDDLPGFTSMLLVQHANKMANEMSFSMYFGHAPNAEELEWYKNHHLSYDNITFRSNELLKNPFYRFRMWLYKLKQRWDCNYS